MDLKISIDDEIYNHFLNNHYSRADIIAVHTALNNAKPEESKSKRYAELAKSYLQGLQAGLAESEE